MKEILIIILVVILVLVMCIGYMFYMLDSYRELVETLTTEIKDSQSRQLATLNEHNKNYNELYKDYSNLYIAYKDLLDDKNIDTDSIYEEFIVTGYSANDTSQGTTNLVRTGFNLDKDHVKKLPIIAVDPNIIPLYSIVEIENHGIFLALDTGGLIQGNRIDILFDDKNDALSFGKQILKARILRKG